MSRKLGIYVNSDRYLDKLTALCAAAKDKGVEVNLLFTHAGTRLTKHPDFEKLCGLAHMALCLVGFESNGLTRPVPCVDERDFATQARHGELIAECDRYLSF